MSKVGLSDRYRTVTMLRCGCEQTVQSNDGFVATTIAVRNGCRKHDRKAENPRAGMSKALRFSILTRDGFACRYCGRKAPEVALHVDHVIPVSRGGPSTPDNLVAACIDCNSGKRDR